ncbi:MAG: ThiF family adenylyltransferase [Fimbriimonadaceae bacterium]|nr:ThiF family adenylyltransferase [Fimbriimonadaceae bacterium]
MFQITDQPIVPPTPNCPTAGGFVTFEGRVRAMNEGRPVQFLEYEAFDEMAMAEGTALVEGAKLRFGLEWAQAIHRVGKLEIGEIAVWIGCGAAHRKEAFLACEFLIDELKHRLPIWKKEHYADGPSEWVNLRRESTGGQLTRSDVFARQIVMPEIGPAGQIALQNARVLVVGAGGLACSALPYLAAAGVGTIGIVEPDLLEPSNLHRQALYGFEGIGRSKARLAAEAIRRLHPFIQIEVFEERLCPDNAERIIAPFDIVVDGTDRFDAKFLMNDACQKFGKPLVQASIYRMEGYIQTILPGGPCLRCQWPTEPVDGCVSTCEEAGVLGVVPGLLGVMQAAEVIKIRLGIQDISSHSQVLVDLRDFATQKIVRTKRADCPSCQVPLRKLEPMKLAWEVSTEEVKQWTEQFICVDLRGETRSDSKIALGQLESIAAPLNLIDDLLELQKTKRLLLVCAKGRRSGMVVYRLLEKSATNVYSLRGGLEYKER